MKQESKAAGISCRILIVDDHAMVRLGLRKVLEESGKFLVSAEASHGQEAIKILTATLKKEDPDIDLVVLNVRMPKRNGFSTLRKIRSLAPTLPVVMFAAQDNPTYFARASAWGANGFLLKNQSSEEIISTLQRVVAGEKVWIEDGDKSMREEKLLARINATLETPLTPREGDVLLQLACGLTNKEIAAVLHIGYETAKEHIHHILNKLNFPDRTQAVVWVLRQELG